MRKTMMIVACMAVLVVMVIVQSAAAQGKLEGVWKVTEVTLTGPEARTITTVQPSLYVFTKKHFSTSGITADKPRPVQPTDKATDAQKLAAWDAFDADAGTYEIKGTNLIMQGVVAKDPEDMQLGKPHIYDFKIQGNTLSLTMKANQDGPLPNPIQWKLVRVE